VTHGAIVKGGYGHSSVYDPRTLLIYIHGGYHSTSVSSYHLSDSLYAYNPKKRTWYASLLGFKLNVYLYFNYPTRVNCVFVSVFQLPY